MKKLLSLFMACALAVSLAACGSSTDDSNTPEPTPTPEPSPVTDELIMPVIPGSNAYDITVGLEQNGLPSAERQEIEGGYTFTATNSKYSYTVETDKNYAVSYGEFYVFDEDNGFLGYCSSMPRDDEKMQETMAWVNDNIGTETSTTIGDMELILGVGENNKPYLEVKAIGLDEYTEAMLDKLLGLE